MLPFPALGGLVRVVPASILVVWAAACTASEDKPAQDSAGPTDHTPPTVTIQSPDSGDEVSGTISVEAKPDDDVGISTVALEVGGVQINELTESPWVIPWDTLATPNGRHSITVRARDAAGNEGTDTMRISVDNQGGVPLGTVLITSPDDDVPACGEVPIYVAVSEPATQVDLWVDGEARSPDLDAPYA